jgi:hypothetical protein
VSLALPAWGAPFALQLGAARVVLDAPAGFADTAFLGSPRLQEVAEALTSASNRVLLFAISDDDLRRFSAGDPPELRRYLLLTTPKALERERIDAQAFARMSAEAMRGVAVPPEGSDIAKLLHSQPVGQASALAQLRRDPAVLSLLQGTRLQPTKIPRLFGSDERQNYLLSSSTLMLVRGKALNLQVYTAYESAQDAAWLRALTGQWVDQLQGLNAH